MTIQRLSWFAATERAAAGRGSIMFSLLCLLGSGATTVCMGGAYEIKVIAKTGQAGLTGMEREVSINDAGRVAFVGQLNNSTTSFEDVFVGDGFSDPVNISGFSGPTRNFANGVHLTNSNSVAARDQVSGSPPSSFIRVWGPAAGDFDTIARGGGGALDDYDSVLARPSMNNLGQVVFCALDGSTTKLVTPDTIGFNELVVPAALRPMIADTGRIVARSGGTNTFPIHVYPYDLSTSTAVSGSLTGLGSSPGISDDGKMVVFYGNPGTGTALYLCFSTDGVNFSAPIRVTGPSGDGVLDPGEEWTDANGDGQVNPGEDGQGFSAFTVDSRVTVNPILYDPKTVTACYQATKDGALGIHTSQVEIDLQAQPITPVPKSPSKVAAVGDTFGPQGQQFTISDLGVYDSINSFGQVAFWVQTDQGQVVARATDRTTLYAVLLGNGNS